MNQVKFLKSNWRWVFVFSLVPLLTFVQGFFSAPNTSDAMIYHLPRVLYWAQEQSVWQLATFTTHDFMPPLSGYFLLQLYLFFEGDRFLFLSQWLAGLVTLVCSWLIVERLTNKSLTAHWSTLFLSGLPILVMQMSSTQVDLVTAAFVVSAYWFAILCVDHSKWQNFLLFGLSSGYAVMAKPTAVFWIFPIGLYLFITLLKDRKVHELLSLITVSSLALCLQGRWLLQNMQLYNSPLGYHEMGNGEKFIYTNEVLSIGVILSNILRNILTQVPVPFGGPVIERLVSSALLFLGTSLQDPSSTWYGSVFHLQRVLFPQEDIVSSPVHVLVILVGSLYFLKKRNWRTPDWLLWSNWLGFFLFCAVLKWQPYHSRLLLPFFILGTVFIFSEVKLFNWIKGLIVVNFFLGVALIILNVSHPFISYTPLKSLILPLMPAGARIPTSVFTTSRDEQYFHARSFWFEPYTKMSNDLSSTHEVQLQLVDEYLYPLMIFTIHKNPSIIFSTQELQTKVWSGDVESTPEASFCYSSSNTLALCLEKKL